MRHSAWLLIGIVQLTISVAADGSTPRMSGDDVAVLQGLVHDDCADDRRTPILVRDEPSDEVPAELPDEGGMERLYGAALRARLNEHARWPLTQLCRKVRVESAERIRAFFEKDRRIPPGWEGFAKEFGAKSYLTISRPAYSADRYHALVSLSSHCGELCGSGHLIELEKTPGGWRRTRSVSTWTS